MTESTSNPEREPPAQVAGERRLERAPSERYGTAPEAGLPRAPGPDAGVGADAGETATTGADPARGVAFGTVAALVGAALIVVFGGALAVSAGLLVVASAVGYSVGLATVIGAGDTLPPTRRSWIAGALAGLGVLLGQVGLWLFARAEGGVLGPIDYLGQTFGVLVPVEVLLAAVVGWWRAR